MDRILWLMMVLLYKLKQKWIKKQVLFISSHLYLFWTLGCYYIFELLEQYELILIVNNEYRCDPFFQKIITFPQII